MERSLEMTVSEPCQNRLHYRLTNEEWLKAVHELTESQKDVLYYLRTLDPFGDRHLDLGVREIARTLGCEPSTVSRALRVLAEKGYIDLELVRVRVKVLSKVLRENNSVAPEQQTGSPRNKRDSETTNATLKQQSRSQRNNQALEPLPDDDSGTPHTYSNSSNSLNPSHSLKRGGEENNSEEENEQEQMNISHEVEKLQEKFSVQQTSTPEDQSSASVLGVVEKPKPRSALPLPKEQLPEWRYGPNPEDIYPGFVDFILKWLCSIPPERDRSKGDAIAYIRKQESGGDLLTLRARCQEWKLAEHRAAENQRQREAAKLGSESPPPPTDIGDLIAEIEAHLIRLEWSREEAFAHMVEHHGWTASHPAVAAGKLSYILDEDLLVLLEVLNEKR
jgi:DNA-binding transcriptional ArsR family regulator